MSGSCFSLVFVLLRDGQKEHNEDLEDVKHRLDLLFKDAYKLETVDDGALCKTNLCIRL